MDGPGLSIFQGGNIQLDSSHNRLEEEEALEDQKRRDEELGNQLHNAFEDLRCDDEYTADSSAHFQSHMDQLELHSSPNNKCNGKEGTLCKGNGLKEEEYIRMLEELQTLKVALESKTRENEHWSKLVQEENKRNDELKKRLGIAEAESCRANMTNKQTHELLVESKAKQSDLEDTILKLKAKIKTLETSNNDMAGNLERVQTLLADAQHKYMMVEKNIGLNADRHTDILLKQVNERNKGQIDMMQQQIDGLRAKLDDKETELRTLDTRYKELQRSREALLVDKAETINQMARSLEDSQRQCQELMSKQDCTQENIRLKCLVNALEQQTSDMQKTIQNLTAQLDSTTTELELMDSILCENVEEIGSPRRLMFSKGNVIGSTPMPTNDRLARLKSELYRSINDQKCKREEIRKLQELIARKNEEIKQLKDDENAALVQITTYKEENVRLENKIRILESEMDDMQKRSARNEEKSAYKGLEEAIEKLNKENEFIKQELKNSQNECEILKKESAQYKKEIEHLRMKLKSLENNEVEHHKLSAQLKNLNTDLEEMKHHNDNLKSNYERVLKENEKLKRRNTGESLKLELEKQKLLLKDAQCECDRLKNLYVEISNSKEVLAIELHKLKQSDIYRELHDEREKRINLERALQLNELKATEFEKLLKKEKIAHDEEVKTLREKIEKEKADSFKSSKNSSSNCAKCIEYVAEITKLEIQSLKMENQCSLYFKEIAELRDKLQESRYTIDDLVEKLLLKDERDKLISELKRKAEQFEEYIKCQGSSNTTSGVSSPKHVRSRDQSVETSPELELNHNRQLIETRIRDEMAKIFAIEIKNIEERFKIRLKELESQNNTLKQDLQIINSELKLRQNEVHILKDAILEERENMKEILSKKDSDAQQLFQQHKIILQKCRDELQTKHNKVAELIKELNERNTQIEAERQSMKAVMNQWEEQRKITDQKEDDWRKIIDELKKEHESAVEQWKAKYNSAKKTAGNYKRYADEKEKHMMQEYDRIKVGYDVSLRKVENKMKEVLEKQNKQMKERIAEIEKSYEDKMNNFKKGIGP